MVGCDEGTVLPLSAEDPRIAHVVLTGFSASGRQLLSILLHQAHLPNGHRPHITILDESGRYASQEEAMASIALDFPGHHEFAQLEWIPCDASGTLGFASLLEACRDPDRLVSVVCCEGDDSRTLDEALHLSERISTAGVHPPPIFVRVKRPDGYGTWLKAVAAGSGPLKNLHPFGGFEHTYNIKSMEANELTRLARLIHYYFCNEGHLPTDPNADAGWSELPVYLKNSNIAAAQHLRLKCRCAGFDPDGHPDRAAAFFNPEVIEVLAGIDSWMGHD